MLAKYQINRNQPNLICRQPKQHDEMQYKGHERKKSIQIIAYPDAQP